MVLVHVSDPVPSRYGLMFEYFFSTEAEADAMAAWATLECDADDIDIGAIDSTFPGYPTVWWLTYEIEDDQWALDGSPPVFFHEAPGGPAGAG